MTICFGKSCSFGCLLCMSFVNIYECVCVYVCVCVCVCVWCVFVCAFFPFDLEGGI